MYGDEVHGILHSTDASAGVVVPIFKAGSTTARTLDTNEYLAITEIQIVAAVGGDCYAFLGPDATLGSGETVIRGTFAANGGMATSFRGTPRVGSKGASLYLIAPAGVVDITFTGRISKA